MTTLRLPLSTRMVLSGSSWTERNAGWILSFCLHLSIIFAAFLEFAPRDRATLPKPATTIKLHFVDAATPPISVAAAAARPSPSSATQADSAAGAAALPPPSAATAAPVSESSTAVASSNGASALPSTKLLQQPASEPPVQNKAAATDERAAAIAALDAARSAQTPPKEIATAAITNRDAPRESSDHSTAIKSEIETTSIPVPSPVATSAAAPRIDLSQVVTPYRRPQTLKEPPHDDSLKTNHAAPMTADSDMLFSPQTSSNSSASAGEPSAQGETAGADGSSLIAQRLRMARADLAAKKTLYNSNGAAEGAVREIDTSDVDPKVAEATLAKYGVSIIYARVNPAANGGYNYLNRAKTPGADFVNVAGPGVYRVFRYGAVALARMSQLEQAELEKQGFDGQKGRVVRIVFGIVPTRDGYDLGVKQFQAEPVPSQDKK